MLSVADLSIPSPLRARTAVYLEDLFYYKHINICLWNKKTTGIMRKCLKKWKKRQ